MAAAAAAGTAPVPMPKTPITGTATPIAYHGTPRRADPIPSSEPPTSQPQQAAPSHMLMTPPARPPPCP
eukprot:4725063-Pyramimonas_sp.AAC.1